MLSHRFGVIVAVPVLLLLLLSDWRTVDGFVSPSTTTRSQSCSTTTTTITPSFLITSTSSSSSRLFLQVVNEETTIGGKTFYEIMEISPNATRRELQDRYRELAMRYHPDRHVSSPPDVQEEMKIKFQTVGRVWSVLKQGRLRTRYNRMLQAEEFKNQVERAASNTMADVVLPSAKKIVDATLPFLRRTTITTAATVSAAADEWNKQQEKQKQRRKEEATATKRGGGNEYNSNNNNNNDTMERMKKKRKSDNTRQAVETLGNALKTGFLAGQAATKIVDGMELMDSANQIKERANQEMERVKALEDQLYNITRQRLEIALVTPQSALSADDAKRILETFKNLFPESKSFRYVRRMKSQYMTAINLLAKMEQEYSERAEMAAQHELQAERRAQEAIRLAQQSVEQHIFKTNLTAMFRELDASERRIKSHVERSVKNLHRQQEKVRCQLLGRDQHFITVTRTLQQQEDQEQEPLTPEQIQMNRERIDELSQQEATLTKEIMDLQTVVNRLQDQAQKLTQRAQQTGVP